MLLNYWTERTDAVVEKEVLLVKASSNTSVWYNKMPVTLPIICPVLRVPKQPQDFTPKVGVAYHLKLSRFGIEGILKTQRKYQRYNNYVLYDINQLNCPFWVVLYK